MAKAHRLFEAGDGRSVTKTLIYLQPGEVALIYSSGWCDASDYIVPHVIFSYPETECDDAMHDLYITDSECTNNTPAFTLSKKSRQARISEPGVYFLRRAHGAESVTVWVKKTQR
jgi:hypothetical protein